LILKPKAYFRFYLMFFSVSRMSQVNVFVFTFTESLFKNFGEPNNAFENALRAHLKEGEVVCGSIDGSASGDGSEDIEEICSLGLARVSP